MGWTQVLTIPAILAVGVVYGTDMFSRSLDARPWGRHVSGYSRDREPDHYAEHRHLACP